MIKNFLSFKKILIAGFVLALIGVFYFVTIKALEKSFDDEQVNSSAEVARLQDRKKIVEIKDGSTYGVLMTEAGVEAATANEIYNSALSVYDLAKIRSGRALELFFENNSETLKKLVYKIDSEEAISVKNPKYFGNTPTSSDWIAEISPIKYETKIVVKSGKVETSMYDAALANNIDERAIVELANAFQWTIDFAMDPRVGDTFKFIYEERYLEGEYIMPGRISAGEYVNDGEKHRVYYFEEDGNNSGYFDEDGNSVQKMFLKAPVSFKYISSGFTTGRRYVEAFNVSTGHRAVDYAAQYGTPIRAVGDGSVVFAGYNGAYGNKITIRHNGTYSTNYCHLSKFAVRYGAKVKQGGIIGYVGSTGFSTGPHLHYEMVKNGVKVNPLREVLPLGKPIADANKERFFSEIGKWQKTLNQ